MTEVSKIVTIFKPEKLNLLKEALKNVGILGMTVIQAEGCGLQGGRMEHYRGNEIEIDLLPKKKLEIIVPSERVPEICGTIQKVLHTGKMGDGKIFVYDVAHVIRISNGSEGLDALDMSFNKKE